MEIFNVYKYLTGNDLFVLESDIEYSGDYVIITIRNGDWINDHLRCDRLMQAVGYKYVNYEIVKDNFDDYTAKHFYLKR